MKRRDFIALIGGAAMNSPLAARAQQTQRMRRIGVLISFQKNDPQSRVVVTLIKRALLDFGWIEGQNVQIIARLTSQGSGDDIVDKAKEIVGLSPDAILASPTRALLSLLKETTNIPIVFAGVSDPLSQGVVASLARPGGNITGFSNPPFSLVGKSLQLLKDIAPNVSRVALMISAGNGSAPAYFRVFDDLAKLLGLTTATFSLHSRPRDRTCYQVFR